MNSPESGLTYNTLMGVTLKSLRKKKDITQSQLMEAVEVSRATWSRIENGQSPIDFDQLTTVVNECFDMSLNEFFTYMNKLDERLKDTIAEEAKDKEMDSSNFLYTLTGLGVGVLVGFLVKQVIEDWDLLD